MGAIRRRKLRDILLFFVHRHNKRKKHGHFPRVDVPRFYRTHSGTLDYSHLSAQNPQTLISARMPQAEHLGA